MESKKWWSSKTLWVNVLGVVGIAAQGITGVQVLGAETQALLLGLANMVLRAVTKGPVEW